MPNFAAHQTPPFLSNLLTRNPVLRPPHSTPCCLLAGGKEDELRKVGYNKYKSVSPSAFGLSGRKAIAVVRAAGGGAKGSGWV